MSEIIRVPDIGNGEGEVIELMVKPGDRIEAEQSLLTLESDKASMEIPSPKAGTVKSIKVKLGDTLKEGDDILELEIGEESSSPESATGDTPAQDSPQPSTTDERSPAEPADSGQGQGQGQGQTVNVPDIGSTGKANVIEILVKVGDAIETDQSLITLESDKASMEIPSPAAGVVESISVQIGDEVGTGDAILVLRATGGASSQPAETPAPAKKEAAAPTAETPKPDTPRATPDSSPADAPSRDGKKVHAGPAVRQLARELGVDLTQVSPSGPRQRILKEDVQSYIKTRLQSPTAASQNTGAVTGAGIPPIPEVDFSQFGEVEEIPLSRLRQIAAVNLHRSWVNVPHVTQFEQADITELEAFRLAQKGVAEKAGVKLTLLPLLLKVCAHLQKEMPDFNSSLAPGGKSLIHKQYVHIGFAVDTPDGLLVPVIRDVDKKGLLELAREAAELADKARNKKLTPEAMQGACFSISSLGHIGGSGFTPIINAPEVAILGVSRATIQPVWDGNAFQPRLMLPLSLSYDHRVINGVAAAHYTRRLSELLRDIRTMLL